MVKKNLLTACGINPLIHIRQKKKIALEIAVKVASVNGPLRSVNTNVRVAYLLTVTGASLSYRHSCQLA
jgi:hypothetical protein